MFFGVLFVLLGVLGVFWRAWCFALRACFLFGILGLLFGVLGVLFGAFGILGVFWCTWFFVWRFLFGVFGVLVGVLGVFWKYMLFV